MATYPTPMIYRPERWSLTIADPTQEPVPLEEAKSHLRVDTSDEDASIWRNIIAARQEVERMTNRSLLTRTHTLKLDRLPYHGAQLVELWGGKLQSVTSVEYVDDDGATQTWASTEYDVDTDSVPGKIGLAYDKSWPSVREWALPVTITYEAGYGTNPGDVPAVVTSAMLLIAADLFEQREQKAFGVSTSVALSAQSLLAGERVYSIY